MKILDYAVAKKLGIVLGDAPFLAHNLIVRALGGGNAGGSGGSGVLPDKNTWEGVIARMDNGTYATDYAIGDCVPLDLGSEGLINMQIAAFDTDDLADGSGKAKVTWIAKELLATNREMNRYSGSYNGWEKCELRTSLSNNVKPLIPVTVLNRIATVTKNQKSYTSANGTTNQTTQDDLWLPGKDELSSTGIYSGLFPDKDSLKKFKVGSTATSSWWLRDTNGNGKFYSVWDDATVGGSSASFQYGVCLGFCTN